MKTLKLTIIFVFVSSLANATGTKSGDVTTTTTAPAGPSVNQNATDAASSNDSGAGQSMMMGGVLAAMSAQAYASQNYGTAALLGGMALLSFLQGGEHGDKAGAATITANNTDAGTDTLKTINPAGFGALNKNIDAFKKGIGGVKGDFKKRTVTVGDKTYPASDFASAASMQAAGFNPDQIAAALDVAAKAEKKITKMGAATATNGFEGGGGGGGVSYVDEAPADAPVGAGAAGLGEVDRGPAGVAGMTKDFNGEPIGVAGDSIFEMMNRRYILKDKQNAFINESDLLLRQK